MADFLNGTFNAFDSAIINAMHNLAVSAGGFFTPLFKAVTFIGEKGIIFFALALILMLFSKTRKLGVCIFGAVACGALITNFILKDIIAIFDAMEAGFRTFTFIIKREIEADFREVMDKHLFGKDIEVKYVFQEVDKLPEGYSVPKGRVKPWGTAHALLCAIDTVRAPFAVINADDYYGRDAFRKIYDFLVNVDTEDVKHHFAMVGYRIKNTVTENGTVSRGVCEMKDGHLVCLEEVTKITPEGTYERDGETVVLPMNTPVSMNLWGLTPDIFDIIETEYKKFLENANLLKDEFYIPLVISDAVRDGLATVKVYHNADRWYGITYREDLPEVKEAIGGYISDGLYEGI